MRKIKLKSISIAIVLIALMLGSCSDEILVEEPRGVFTPDFFTTELGVQGGLTYLYQSTRSIYGFAYFLNLGETGTDEYAAAQSADNNFHDLDLAGQGNLSSTSGFSIGRVWGTSFPAINTASGIIENAEAVNLDNSLIAEAKFFRAFYYFLLVQTYGGVPLDLGGGELKFNNSVVRTSVRNTVPEVYTKAIFPDLEDAVNDLPDNPRLTGTVTKNVARLFLAKAYLTYGWWLENPNSIPTYPEASRTDPDGNSPSYYFQGAYDVAMDGINNPGPYRLLDCFYDVHVATNDRHEEMLFYSDRTEESQIYNEADLGWSGTDGGGPNTAVWMVTPNYTTITVDGVSAVQREAAQSYGRPWTRMAPTINVFTETFAEKDLDSRYDATFVSSYRGNWDKGGDTTPTITAANGMEIAPGDAVISFLDDYDPSVNYVNGGNLGGGEIAGRSDYVINLNEINRRFYPGLWKLGTYRTDNAGGLGSPNGALTRPFPIAKFSELYLVAAEAAVKGASGSMSARDLVNVIRARAGKWCYDNGENEPRVEDNSAAMVAATPAVVDIDFILAERSREYFGEGYRWYDLVRTQKWTEYASSYEIGGNSASDHSPTVTNRTIQPYHYLRPIPRSQIDDMDMSQAEKDAYQNPGYQ
ncbi:RagB/SusD family nutrient uptake outer membrane protein [Aegicerativicinus sediminis]|uniref:RagB/SusD family nutrient uptake outer membrane protein n=1 Tax=Aegicerativicinus sediminis TaxID=2893202 RepID=UPI001E49060C|nr:RagB/SusD family nutrient uptake outer membrane protein [Aegicerativicinus sediminis]